MKLLVFAALFVAVTASWQSGKLYKYDATSYTLASLQKGATSGAVLQGKLLLRPQDDGQVLVKLENPQYVQVHESFEGQKLPDNLSYQSVPGLDQIFQVQFTEGRIRWLKIPSKMSVAHENLLKGLIGNLQVDTTPRRCLKSDHDFYDKQSQQGQFRKMETDVTGDCETLYTILPLNTEWKRELPHLPQPESRVVEISKSKNYANCAHQISYHFGVPEGADWSGYVKHHDEEQFIKRATVSRIIASGDGTIYKSETKSSVYVNPLMYGKQNAEVVSNVSLILESVSQDDASQWQLEENARMVKNLLYSIFRNSVDVDHSSSSSSSSESKEQAGNDQNQRMLTRHPRSLERRRLSIPGENVYSMRPDNRPLSFLRPIPRDHVYSQKPGPDYGDRPLTIPGDDDHTSQNQVNLRQNTLQAHLTRSSSSSSDQSSDSFDSNDASPNFDKPAYAALYMQPHTHDERNNYQALTQKLVQEIAQQLQNPNSMPKLDTLSKVSVLVRYIASMSFDQLTQVSRSIEIGQQSSNKVKADMWMVYRDCVTEAGTLPAFQQIKTWINSKKLQNEEAAQVIGTLVNTLRYPTKEVMIQFFELAMKPEIRQQPYLNTTVLLAATKFINLGHVNNVTARSRYPTHMYGRLTWRSDQFVQKEIIPVLKRELEKAIQEEDSHKAQVYIRAIGNLGHRGIIDVLKPYLEGKYKVSTYLRTWMINSLDILAWQQDHHVSSILYNFLKNTAEPYEVRVTALQNLFKGHVTQAMMQGMAEITHNDPSIHVRAAIKSVITSASKLKNIRFMTLAKSAQETEPMLTKEEFGQQYFGKYLSDQWDSERGWGNMRIFSAVDSEDSLLPKFFEFMLWNKFNGWTAPNKVSYSVSNVQTLIKHLWHTIGLQKQVHLKQQNQLKYSVEKIVEMLNIKRDSSAPFEGNLYYDLMNYQRIFALSESDIQQLPQFIGQQMSKLAQGVDFHYTKIFNQDQVSIMFPVAMGVPFVYKYKQPTLIHVLGQAKGSIQEKSEGTQQFSANLYKEIQMTLARNLDGKAGFLDTLSGTYANAGVVNKLQINLPIKVQIQVKSGKAMVKLELLRPDQDTNLVHFSVWPYTSNQQKDSHTTMAHDPSSKLVIENSRVVTFDKTFGHQSTGVQFHLQGYSHSKDYTNIGNVFQGYDFISGLMGILHQKDVALTHFNFKCLGKQSQTRSLILNVAYGKIQKHGQKSSVGNEKFEVDNMHSFGYESEDRCQEIVNKVSTDIQYAEAKYIDLNATFDGAERSEYVLTAAMADSLVNPNIHYILYGNRNHNKLNKWEVSVAGKIIKPATSSLNFLESLKPDFKINFEFGIKAQQEQQNVGEIKFQGAKVRSQELIEDLKNSQLGQLCMQQMTQRNYYLSACREMILRAHVFDELKTSINYQNVSPTVKYGAYQIYRMLRHIGFWYADENVFRYNKEGKIDIEAKANFTENKMNIYTISPIDELILKNIPTPRLMGKILSLYPVFSPMERVANLYTNSQYQPFCTVDGNRIETFLNREVDYRLSNVWHVVMNARENWPWNKRQVVILARKQPEKQLEAQISYESYYGQRLNIELKTTQEGSVQLATADVECGYPKVSEGHVVVYRDEKLNQNILEQYVLPDGVLLLNIDEGVLRVLYDGQRLVVLPNAFRNQSNGICGLLGGEQRDDCMTPQGLIDDPQLFGVSYALNQEGGDQNIMRLQQQLQDQVYRRVYQYTSIWQSDDQWRVPMTSSSSSSEEDTWNVILAKSYGDVSKCELQEQVQFFHRHGELCLTVDKVKSCTKLCKGHGYEQQQFNVVCRPKKDQEFKKYKQQILLGENPSVVSKDMQQVTFKVPYGCKN